MQFNHFHIHIYSMLAFGLVASVVYIISLRNCIDLKNEKIQNLKVEVVNLHSKIELNSKTDNQLANSKELIASEIKNKLNCNFFKEELAGYEVEFQKQLKVISLLKSEVCLKDKEIVDLKEQGNHNVQEMKAEIEKCKSSCYKATSCIPFGNSSGIHEITVPGFGSFPVLCDSDSDVSPGWIVIHKRINGNVDFNRNWTEYRNGFGSLDGDFFIGLEKLHRLTTSALYEVSVHTKGITGAIDIVHYDHFVIEGEENQYKVQKLGTKSKNAEFDCLKDVEGQKFSTFDRDNDSSEFNCAWLHDAGWWYKKCLMRLVESVFYLEFDSELEPGMTKLAKMLIRPLMNF